MTVVTTIYSVFSFIGFLFCAIPFTWIVRNGNTGFSLLTAWLGIFCLSQFVNAILWNGNMVNWSPVWCDICTRIYIASGFGIPASTLCVFRRLYLISIARGTMETADKALKRRQVAFDLALGLGLPILGLIFAYIAGGHRFNIFEDIGCMAAIHDSPVSIALVNIPPILVGLVTARYAVLTIGAFNRRRIEFNDLLAEHSNLTSHFYLRLMCFSSLEVLVTIPVATFFLYYDLTNDFAPWPGWNSVQSHYSRVVFYPRSIWQSNSLFNTSVQLGRWLGIIGAINFFACFGFAEEARMNYRAAYLTVANHLGISAPSSELSDNPRPASEKNDIGAPVFAHTASTNISMPTSDVEGNNLSEKGNEIHISAKVLPTESGLAEPKALTIV